MVLGTVCNGDRDFWQLRCITPSGRKLEKKERCELKGTRHNGRSGKDGVYNPLHNDRRFDLEYSEHIDNERVRQNIYWDCYQGYTTMADRGKEDNFSFNQIELAYYVEHYSDYVMNQNARHARLFVNVLVVMADFILSVQQKIHNESHLPFRYSR